MKQKSLFVSALGLGCLFCLVACKTTTDDYRPVLGTEYFPLEVGKFIVYEVDSTIFDPTGDSMVFSTKTFFREEVVDTLQDNNGETLYKIERFERKAEDAPWTVSKVFTRSIQGGQGLETIDNLRFIKLTFPVRRNNTWNGLAHFDPSFTVVVAGETLEMFKGWSYRIEDLGEPDTVGTFVFDEVLTLREADTENDIELRISREKYARGIGLVYRERWILDNQCLNNCPVTDTILVNGSETYVLDPECLDQCESMTWEEKAEKGFILRQRIIQHN